MPGLASDQPRRVESRGLSAKRARALDAKEALHSLAVWPKGCAHGLGVTLVTPFPLPFPDAREDASRHDDTVVWSACGEQHHAAELDDGEFHRKTARGELGLGRGC